VELRQPNWVRGGKNFGWPKGRWGRCGLGISIHPLRRSRLKGKGDYRAWRVSIRLPLIRTSDQPTTLHDSKSLGFYMIARERSRDNYMIGYFLNGDRPTCIELKQFSLKWTSVDGIAEDNLLVGKSVLKAEVARGCNLPHRLLHSIQTYRFMSAIKKIVNRSGTGLRDHRAGT
jgi:hypothetical protein